VPAKWVISLLFAKAAKSCASQLLSVNQSWGIRERLRALRIAFGVLPAQRKNAGVGIKELLNKRRFFKSESP
jgi:hypothetical protein